MKKASNHIRLNSNQLRRLRRWLFAPEGDFLITVTPGVKLYPQGSGWYLLISSRQKNEEQLLDSARFKLGQFIKFFEHERIQELRHLLSTDLNFLVHSDKSHDFKRQERSDFKSGLKKELEVHIQREVKNIPQRPASTGALVALASKINTKYGHVR